MYRISLFLSISLFTFSTFKFALGQAEVQNPNSAAGLFWRVKGNSGTVDGTNFLGTVDGVPLSFRIDNDHAGKLGFNSNTSLGWYAATTNPNAYGITAIGVSALRNNATGVENTAIGAYALDNNTSGSGNTVVGFEAGNSPLGNNNVGIGYRALYNSSFGSNNICIGANTMYSAPSGNNNIAIGVSAMRSSLVSESNIAIGNAAMSNTNTTTRSIAIGDSALYQANNAANNIAIGSSSLLLNTSGFNNVAIGYRSMRLSNGLNNTGVGNNTLFSNTNGHDNTAVGFNTLYTNNTGTENTAIGRDALYNNTTGFSNTVAGHFAGITNTTGNRNTLLGDSADVGLPNLTNATAIGWRTRVDASNSMVLGSVAGVNGVSTTVKVGIGTTTPAQQLHVAGTNASIRVGGLATGGGYNTTPATSPYNVIVADNVGDMYCLANPGGSLNNYVLSMNGAGSPVWSTTTPNAWGLTGNSGTTPVANFMGTIDSQTVVFRTNNIERARIDAANGNMAVGGTGTAVGKISAFVPATDNTTSAMLASQQGNSTSNTFALRIENLSSTNSTKTGIINTVNNTGTGLRYGINNSVSMNASSTFNGYGVRNTISGNGSGSHFGTYNSVFENGTGTPYGSYNDLSLASITTPAYGTYNELSASGGNRYGTYNSLNSTTGPDSVFGTLTDFYGTGTDFLAGTYNLFNNTGTGSKTGVYNAFVAAPGTKYGVINKFEKSTGTRYGMYNDFDDSASTKYGVYNNFSGLNSGAHYGLYTVNTNTSASTRYGTYGQISGNTGAAYGHYVSISSGATNASSLYGYYSTIATGASSTSVAYGVFSNVNDNGTGTKYGGYFNATGASNYGVYGQNTSDLGWAGYFYGDLQARGSTKTCQLISDYSDNLVRFGTCNVGSDWSNGTTVAGITVDYVADFDLGTVDGTAVGLGSIEFVLDGVAETHINNSFSPTTNITYDLGSNTYSWDDVYADDFWNVSDRRAKKNVKDMSYGLREILKLRTISYELNDDPFNEPKIGLVAQEVQQLVPEAVKTHNYQITDESKPNEFNKVELDRMMVSYTNMVPVLVKGMQEQQQQIDELKQQVQRLTELLEQK